MCLIISKQSGVNLPDEQNLINGFRRNSDGIGIAWRKRNEKNLLAVFCSSFARSTEINSPIPRQKCKNSTRSSFVYEPHGAGEIF